MTKFYGMKSFQQSIWLIPLLAFTTWVAINGCATANVSRVDTEKKPFIVFLITKDTNNYEAHVTVPKFAEFLEKEHRYKTEVLTGKGEHGNFSYSNLDALSHADVLVVFARRIALPHSQLKAIKEYISKGKPVVGIRTAHHAFALNNYKKEAGHEEWPSFAADILGCENKGYGPVDAGYTVSIIPEAAGHPVLKNIRLSQWRSKGSIYHVSLLDKEANVLLQGKIDGKTEPVAWTRVAGKNKVFYTSLGYPDDFETAQFRTLLVDGIRWVLNDK